VTVPSEVAGVSRGDSHVTVPAARAAAGPASLDAGLVQAIFEEPRAFALLERRAGGATRGTVPGQSPEQRA
jgi:hypothetical protein